MQYSQSIQNSHSPLTKALNYLVDNGIISKQLSKYILLSCEVNKRDDEAITLLKFVDDISVAKAIEFAYGGDYKFKGEIDFNNWQKRVKEGSILMQEREGLIVNRVSKEVYSYRFRHRRVLEYMIGTKLVDFVPYVVPYSLYVKALNLGKIETEPYNRIREIEQSGVDIGKKILEFLLEQAYYQGVSDIHIEYVDTGSIVRFRVGGTLRVFTSMSDTSHFYVINTIKAEIGKGGESVDKRKDGRLSHKVGASEFDVRVNIMPASPYSRRENSTFERAVLRILRKQASLGYSLKSMGLTEREIDIVKTAINSAYGMVLTSGPTSSGKTTTLYAMLNTVNALEKKVITVEDPIEFQNYYLWHQHQVSEVLPFEEILKGILREDPDVCLVGEVRDKDSARAMIHLASTGHLTFSTIHANNCFEIIKRLKDLEIEEKEIVEYGVLFMAQRLLRRSCPYCQTSRKLTDAEARFLGLLDEGDIEVIDNEGCEACDYTGSLGERILVLEMLPLFDETIKEGIESGSIRRYKQAMRFVEEQFGIESMLKKALRLNREGKVSVSEIISKLR